MAVQEEGEEAWTDSLTLHHRAWAPELFETLWTDPHSSSGVFIYFDMICPPWAVAAQRDEGLRSLDPKHFPLPASDRELFIPGSVCGHQAAAEVFYCTHS